MSSSNKHYISPIDIKLAEFDAKHEKSASQLAEIAKYQRIYQLRDQKIPISKYPQKGIWENF